MSAIDKQIGGDHYKGMAIQPIEYIQANGLSYIEGNIVKYISRWREKNGIEDLKKIKHYVEFLIEEVEGKKGKELGEVNDQKLQAYLNQTGCEGGTCDS